MKIERTKNASKNITAGLFLKIYQMITPFLMRTAMIYYMGEQYLGLNSLFYSILHVLNLAELGVGNAMVFSMYKPIAEDDKTTICALMKLYRRYYRIIGSVICAVGILLTPAIPNLISGEIPAELDVYILYWMNLGATVLSYWLFAYRNCLLQAHQRNAVSSWISVITTTVQYGIQLAVMILCKNYYIHVMTALATQAANNVITAIVTRKMYPQYSAQGRLPKEMTKSINGRIRDLFTGKIGSVIINNSDSVIISAFMGLAALTIFQNYFFIMTSVIGIAEIMLQSIMAGVGNSYITETKEKNFQDLEKFSFLFLWLIGVCACCFLVLYQPFMELWMGKNRMVDDGVVLCFVLYFVVYCFNRLLNICKDAAGLWRVDRFRPLVKALVNLILNLWWVNKWGYYGILLSTVFSIAVVGMPWILHNLFTYCYEKKWLRDYLRQVVKMIGAIILAGCAVYLICLPICGNLWLTLLLRAIVCLTVPNALFFVLLHRAKQFRPSVALLDRVTKNKLKLEKRLFRND